jgi:chorismate mutase/prephenate dehydratase
VVDIGRRKRRDGTPIYAPHREQEVLSRVLAKNPGPLSGRTVEAIYRELMSGSFTLELPLRVGFLGPAGSFSHLAAVRHFGSSVEFDDLHTIDGVFREVAAGRIHYGLAPYENSIVGGITDTLDAFQEYDVTVYAEALVEVSHHLLGNAEPVRIRRIYSKPQVFDQCRRWLATQYPEAELIPCASSAAAVKQAVDESDAAAVGSALAAEIYGAKILFENIQDKPNNITRFLIIAKQSTEPSGDDKTTLMFATAHKPGALVDVLSVFRNAGINLSHIEKRPSGRENWEYTFFVDLEGHRREARIETAIREADRHCRALRVLGSYPRAKRII